MLRPPPDQPADCRRENAWRFAISLLPATSVVVFGLMGKWVWAAAIFWGTFSVISLGTIVPRSRLFGPHVSSLSSSQARRNEVWITLDDGPDPKTTPAILDLLDRYQAKAGFFLIGQKADAHPELVRDIARRGHLIGNHSQTHPAASFWWLRPQRMWEEIAGCQQTLTDILGTAPVWFRPPVGHHNLFIHAPLRALGLTMAIWNCRGFDGIEKNVSRILQRISRSLRPGAIVLLHDGTATCLEALEGTLRLMQERGLQAALPEALHPAAQAPSLSVS